MADRLSAQELAELVGCAPNQKAVMIDWLGRNKWIFLRDRNGLPIVARAYYERKLGIVEAQNGEKYADSPNRSAFQKIRNRD